MKREFATTRRITTLAEALHDADVFLGVSKADTLTPEMLRTMSGNPIVMALANPDPEIAYDTAMLSRQWQIRLRRSCRMRLWQQVQQW